MDRKNIAIVILAALLVMTIGVIVNLNRAWQLHDYAIANNCTWSWNGTSYGDDRDYVCK